MRTLFTAGFLVELILGLALLAAPTRTAEALGLNVTPPGVLLMRLYGSALLGFAVLLFMGRRIRGRGLRRAVLASVLVYGLVSSILLVTAQIQGLMNPLGWGVIDVHVLLTLAFGFYLFKPRKNEIR